MNVVSSRLLHYAFPKNNCDIFSILKNAVFMLSVMIFCKSCFVGFKCL